MSDVLHSLGDFMKVWGPWITMSLIPTLIVGLSKSPKTRGFVGVLKYILQFLSIVTPSDHPGTFKMPLTAPAKMPPKSSDTKKTSSGPLGPILALIVTGSLIGSITLGGNGCSWLTNIGKGSKDGIINCSVEAVMSQAANLIATVKAIVTGGAVNWKEQLDSLKTLGEDALACALYVVGDELQKQSVPPTTAVGDSPEKQKMRAVSSQGAKKTQLYLNSNNWKPMKGQ